MSTEQHWRTESYKGMDIHVTALPHKDAEGLWDYTVRVAHPGMDSGSLSELTATAGDDADYSSAELAVSAGFLKGYAMVDAITA